MATEPRAPRTSGTPQARARGARGGQKLAITMAFVEGLKAVKERRKWSRADFRRLCALPPSTLDKWRAGCRHGSYHVEAARLVEVCQRLRAITGLGPADLGLTGEACAAVETRLRADHAPPAAPGGITATPHAIDLHRLPIPTDPELFLGRGEALGLLERAWADGQVSVIQFHGTGGVGKSTVIWQWLDRVKAAGYPHVTQALAWSFHSQGEREPATDSYAFFEVAADHFAPLGLRIAPEDHGRADRVGRAVAGAFIRTGGILVLDGLEPLQHPPHAENGRVRDGGVAALLAALRDAPLPDPSRRRLLILTTRWPVPDLRGSGLVTAPVDVLTEDEGASLLEQFRLPHHPAKHLTAQPGSPSHHRAGLPQAAFKTVAREYGRHPLTLVLLSSYLLRCHDGDLRLRRLIPFGGCSAAGDPSLHARRVMKAYEAVFAHSDDTLQCACRRVLLLLGLFDRPADSELLWAVRHNGPPIPGLTDGLEDPLFAEAVDELRRLRLVAPGRPEDPTVDAHPLVRAHFGSVLKRDQPAWKEAHRRLYRHLVGVAKPFPETVREMTPLYLAVRHGCEAGLQQEVLDQVYRKRIQRGHEVVNTKKLGAIGAEVEVLAYFFDAQWTKPASALKEADRGFLLHEVGYDLRALGRLWDAIPPLEASIRLAVKLGRRDGSTEHWAAAAMRAGNLSGLHLSLGHLDKGRRWAEQGVKYGDRGGHLSDQVIERCRLADADHQLGHLAMAKTGFFHATRLQAEREPGYPLLYSFAGFWECDLLLDCGEAGAVADRASRSLDRARGEGIPFDIGLSHLSLAHAHRLLVKEGDPSHLGRARAHADDAVDFLRRSGVLDYLPRGLLGRAEVLRSAADFIRAEDDLKEAREIVEYGQMRRHLADYHLVSARLYVEWGKVRPARDHLSLAGRIVDEIGYRRRDPEVSALAERLR